MYYRENDIPVENFETISVGNDPSDKHPKKTDYTLIIVWSLVFIVFAVLLAWLVKKMKSKKVLEEYGFSFY